MPVSCLPSICFRSACDQMCAHGGLCAFEGCAGGVWGSLGGDYADGGGAAGRVEVAVGSKVHCNAMMQHASGMKDDCEAAGGAKAGSRSGDR